MSNWKSILQNRLRCRISLSVDDGNAWYEANVSDNVVIILLTLAVPKLIAIADVCSDVNLGVAKVHEVRKRRNAAHAPAMKKVPN